MRRYLILNGPNLNMLGIREKEIYGNQSYEALVNFLNEKAKELNVEVDIRQSNHEGDLVDWIQEAYFGHFDGIVINPAAYTHTSVAIADAVKAIAPLPVVEVHLSDISTREEFRHHSYVAPYCVKQIKGYGFEGYAMALEELISKEA